jgi:glycosyltransferase involved in cell wall biosynthesis
MTKFSVIIPTRNRVDFLKEAVASVTSQNYRDFEVLIINDGSEPVAEFSDNRVRIIDNNQNGAVAARNLGVAEADGRYIAFLDDDDYWVDKTHLAQANAALTDMADFYYANGVMVYPDGSRQLFSRKADRQTLIKDNTVLISTVCYRKDMHKQLSIFDDDLPYYWDWDWYLRVANAGFSLSRSNRIAAAIRVHAQNMSGDDNRKARQDNLNLLCAKHGLVDIVLKNHLDFVVRPVTA